jgi:hypothetical protein
MAVKPRKPDFDKDLLEGLREAGAWKRGEVARRPGEALPQSA